jgi:hypothetical protein
MPHMSYCRFRNTLNDLRDCENNFDNINSIEELVAAKHLLQTCQRIVDSIDMEDLLMQEELYYEESEEDYRAAMLQDEQRYEDSLK